VQKIQITSCYDNLLWYNNQVGKTFTSYREYDDSYLVRCPDGLSNIIYKVDCEIIKGEINE
jgi:hypothetical protein